MPTRTLDVNEAQVHLTDLLTSVAAGTEVILTQGNTPVARLSPIAAPPSARVAGLHAGAAWISENFDDPLPDNFWAAGE